MAYVVTAQISRSGPRTTSRRFTAKHEAIDFLERTRKQRKGSNPRLKVVK